MPTNFTRAKLSKTSFRNCDVSTAKFYLTDLIYADFTGATLHDVEFDCCNLKGAILKNVDAKRARFFNCNLSHANLAGACLAGAGFADVLLTHTKFVNVDLAGAILAGVRFIDSDCTGTMFSNVRHLGASFIDTKTSFCYIKNVEEAIAKYDLITRHMRDFGANKTAVFFGGYAADPRCVVLWHVNGQGGFGFVPDRECIIWWDGMCPSFDEDDFTAVVLWKK